MDATRARQIAAAQRYAESEKSDPFAFKRAMTHINNGIAGISEGKDFGYDAEETRETMSLPTGVTFSDGSTDYQVKAWKNKKRP